LFILCRKYLPVDRSLLPFSEFIDTSHVESNGIYVHNYGALSFVDALLGLLEHPGCVLINDYTVEATVLKDIGEYQRFGGATGIGLNFHLLKRLIEARSNGFSYVEPDGETGRIAARLMGRDLSTSVVAGFREMFGKAALEAENEPIERAREAMCEDRYDAALSLLTGALATQPENWLAMEDAARLLAHSLNKWEAGLEMAEKAFMPSIASVMRSGPFRERSKSGAMT
jgi:hypothetical protein